MKDCVELVFPAVGAREEVMSFCLVFGVALFRKTRRFLLSVVYIADL